MNEWSNTYGIVLPKNFKKNSVLEGLGISSVILMPQYNKKK